MIKRRFLFALFVCFLAGCETSAPKVQDLQTSDVIISDTKINTGTSDVSGNIMVIAHLGGATLA